MTSYLGLEAPMPKSPPLPRGKRFACPHCHQPIFVSGKAMFVEEFYPCPKCNRQWRYIELVDPANLKEPA